VNATTQTSLVVGVMASVVAIFAWVLYLRWLFPRLARPTPLIFAINVIAIGCLGPGMFWVLIYTLDARSVTLPSERNVAFHTYLAVVAILALYSLIRILQIQKSRKKAHDDGPRSV
jgi:drug/metabolite transporter (DMT)-like permease